jgi:hypothetical protein
MNVSRAVNTVVALLVLATAIGACAAQTALGKAKEGLLYDRELAVGILTGATQAYDAKGISQAQFERVVDLYRLHRAAHNVAVDAVALAEAAAKSGKPYDPGQLEALRAGAARALKDLVDLATLLGIRKP